MQKYNKLNKNPYGSHQRIIQLVGKNKKVLDVGCSVGLLSKFFRKNGCRIVGIELDKKSAKIAKQYCEKVIIGDVEAITLDYPKEYFDVIVFGDILEHLKNPQEVLLKFKKYLKKEGYIVVSVPNVAHITVRIMLLFGNWDYKETGILDKTHLRFFTKKTAIELIKNSKLEVEEIFYTPYVPFLKLRKLSIVRNTEYFITKIFPTLFAHQFIIKCKKKRDNNRKH